MGIVQVGFGLICTAGFILTRLFVDLFAPTAGPFALIYPFALIATLFGSWKAGLASFATAFLWAWYMVLPHAALMQLARPSDGPRTLVNAVSVTVVIALAEMFRSAVRRGVVERDVAIMSLAAREAEVREQFVTLERQFADRAREYTQTWDVSPDLLGVLNTAGFFETSNPAWQTHLALPKEQISTTHFIDFVHPLDIERTLEAWAQINEGLPVLRFENRYRGGDDAWHWLSWVVVPEGDKFYASAREITADKLAEESLAVAEDALRQSQKLEAIGQLTGGVAHDFNNLLTVIRGSVDLLRRPDLAPERRKRYIDAIGDTADRATKLTGQLLAFARRQSLQPEVFDSGQSLIDIAHIVRTLCGSRIVLQTHITDDPCYICADRSQFDTALVNLCVNARDAMQGEGELTIAAGPVSGIPELRSHPPVVGDFVAVTVTDSGTGIAPDDLIRIFEPFFTTKPVGGGTGLGLSQVIGFAKQSDGDIRVDSKPGNGTTFTLYLPRVYQDGVGQVAVASEAEVVDGNGICVLVVEDNEQVGAFATAALHELGYESILATNAERALEQLERAVGRYHIVFSDVVMPGMNGVDLAREIRTRHPDVPVILTSGYSHVLAQNGSHGFELLHKPYSIEQLSGVLRKAVAWHKQAQARTSVKEC